MKTYEPVIVAALLAATVTATSYGGISGGGAPLVNGISGGGAPLVNGISGGGAPLVNGISGGGAPLVNGISGGGAQLLVVGLVEAINAPNKTAIVLGQTVHAASFESLAVGNTAAVYGTTRADGSIEASAIQSRGIYVPGATLIFISGIVQKAAPSVGRVVVGGVTIDLTSVMSQGMFSPTVGT